MSVAPKPTRERRLALSNAVRKVRRTPRARFRAKYEVRTLGTIVHDAFRENA